MWMPSRRGQDGGGHVGGELEQRGRARLTAADADVAQAFGELESADRLAGLAAGEQSGRGAVVADGGVTAAVCGGLLSAIFA